MNCLKLKAISFAFLLAAGLPVCAEAMQWPDTAQTLCYDNSKEIPCPTDENSPFYGQDAQYQGPVRSYTKLGPGGVALPDDATSWIMVRDNVTGLTWEMKNNLDGTQDYSNPHDADNFYLWCASGKDYCLQNEFKDQEDFIESLNSQSFGGNNDWRVPSLNELSSLIYAGKQPLVDWKYFPIFNSTFWTSTYDKDVDQSGFSWIVNFANGKYSIEYSSGYSTSYVIAVRGGK